MSEGGFFSFRTLISNTIIQTVYVIGAVLITLGGLIMMAAPFLIRAVGQGTGSLGFQGGAQIFAGFMTLVAGNLLWRLLCEGWILLFSMHDMMASIERKLKAGDDAGEQARLLFEQLRATEANNDVRHEELLNALRALGQPYRGERLR